MGCRVEEGEEGGDENTVFVGILWIVMGFKKKSFAGEAKDDTFRVSNVGELIW